MLRQAEVLIVQSFRSDPKQTDAVYTVFSLVQQAQPVVNCNTADTRQARMSEIEVHASDFGQLTGFSERKAPWQCRSALAGALGQNHSNHQRSDNLQDIHSML